MSEYSADIIYDQPDGCIIHGDCRAELVYEELKKREVRLGVTDPPYGGIVNEEWDKLNQRELADFLLSEVMEWQQAMPNNSAFYMWGGVGKPGNRAFLEFALRVEESSWWEIKNWITWSKKRAYGVKDNFLFTREELLYLIKGKPLFNIPLLETKRGYPGFNEKYPAKSDFYRRTNVWMDITEIMRGKVSVAEKPVRLYEIPIETSSNPGDWVFDPFAGSGTCGVACRNLGRKFLLVERDAGEIEKIKVKLGVK